MSSLPSHRAALGWMGRNLQADILRMRLFRSRRAKSPRLDSSVELLTSTHIRQPGTFYVQRDFMIEINRRTQKSARSERYGWNPHISSIARTPYSFWKREDTRDGPALVAEASFTSLIWSYLFVLGDRAKQRRWAMVAGDELAIRSGPRSCPPHWQSAMVAPVQQRRPPVFLGSLDKHE